MSDENYFVNHCEEICGLGYFHYKCPACGRLGSDYDEAWWDHENVYTGEPLFFPCEHCKVRLVVRWTDLALVVEPANSPPAVEQQ